MKNFTKNENKWKIVRKARMKGKRVRIKRDQEKNVPNGGAK